MSINKLISIRNPIIDALDMVGGDRSVDMPIFTTWAVQAEKEIMSKGSMVRQKAVLTITGCKAQLPCGAVILQRAIMGDHGCDCESLFNNCFNGGNVFVNTGSGAASSFLIVDVYTGNDSGYYGGYMDYQIQDNAIIFNTDRDGEKITIQYIGYKEDENGFVMISENHSRAITEYILWKYGVRSEYAQKQLSPVSTKEHQREWNRLCRHARAMDSILTEVDREQIAQALNDPYAGRGLWVNMYPTSYNYYY